MSICFTRDHKARLMIGVAGGVVLLIVLIRTAWVNDDSYITFRTSDNFLHGYGLRWNVDERVQSYTHPLWLAVFTATYAATREPYYTSIALGILFTLATVLFMVARVAAKPGQAIACLVMLVSSKAFIDFSTSGLENSLSHLLLVLFLWRWWTEPLGERRIRRLSFIAALCLLNRIDLAVLVGPALLIEAWRVGPRTALGPLLVGFMPFLAWEVFSLVYYGFLFPNTAYAKLNTGIPEAVLFRKGLFYARATALSDPVTFPIILLAPLAIVLTRRWQDWPLVAGLALSGLYVISIGGDFMIGRFFTPLIVWSVALLAHAVWPLARVSVPAAATAFLVLGLTAPHEPALLSGYHSRANNTPRWWLGEVIDSRQTFYPDTGLLEQRPGQERPAHGWTKLGLRLRQAAPPVYRVGEIGFVGYFAGPRVHILDPFALSDPLLARLPADQFVRAGHYPRTIPDGYIETLTTGVNRIADPDLAAYYDRLRLIVAGNLWSRERFLTIAGMLRGQFDHKLRRYQARLVAGTKAP